MKYKIVGILASCTFLFLTGMGIKFSTTEGSAKNLLNEVENKIDFKSRVSDKTDKLKIEKNAKETDMEEIKEINENESYNASKISETSKDELENKLKNSYINSHLNNRDTVGWIFVENTRIDYPIMHRSNDFYLRHDSSRKYSVAGSIFLDESIRDVNSMSLLHGHNMDDGSMFSDLLKFKDKAFADVRSIFIYTQEGLCEYKVIDALNVEQSVNIVTNFENNDEYLNHLNSLGVDDGLLHEDEKYIILNTCNNIDTTHTLIVAKKL